MKRILLLSTVALFVLCGCKKWQHQFPEDSGRTKKTPFERLAGKSGKWWTLQNATVNGIDYTDSVYQKMGIYKIYFSVEESNVSNFTLYKGVTSSELDGGYSAVWNFTDDFIQLEHGREHNGQPYNYAVAFVLYYKAYEFYSGFYQQPPAILRLENNIFKISTKNKEGDSTYTNTYISN